MPPAGHAIDVAAINQKLLALPIIDVEIFATDKAAFMRLAVLVRRILGKDVRLSAVGVFRDIG